MTQPAILILSTRGGGGMSETSSMSIRRVSAEPITISSVSAWLYKIQVTIILYGCRSGKPSQSLVYIT